MFDRCLNSLYYKSSSGRKPELLHSIEKVAILFHTEHLDHVGTFIRSRKKNTQILVIVDGYEVLRAQISLGHVCEWRLEVTESINSNLWSIIPHRDRQRDRVYIPHVRNVLY